MNVSHSFNVAIEQMPLLHEVKDARGRPASIVANAHLEILREFLDIVVRFQQSRSPESV